MAQLMKQIPRKAIQRIIDYMWDCELKHLQENIDCIETYARRHIFFDLETVNNWLNDYEPKSD